MNKAFYILVLVSLLTTSLVAQPISETHAADNKEEVEVSVLSSVLTVALLPAALVVWTVDHYYPQVANVLLMALGFKIYEWYENLVHVMPFC